MPVYNAAAFLDDAIESIRSQTLKNWELLIVDDASTDGSWDIIRAKAKADKRIKIFRNKSNKGLVKSLNSVIGLSRGTFVARMDGDDISLPTRFAKQVAYLRKHKNIVACGGQEIIMDEQGENIAFKYFPTDPDECYRMIANFMVIQPPLLMARGDVFRSLRYENHIFKNDDISMHFKLLQHGSFGNVDEIIFKYRKRPSSITHRDPKHVFFLARAVRMNAIKNHSYRPTVGNALLLLVESAVVTVLPNAALITIFELIRHTKRLDIKTASRILLRPAFARALR
jgi:glycosyltransferase involved in cell wall biosynthesis